MVVQDLRWTHDIHSLSRRGTVPGRRFRPGKGSGRGCNGATCALVPMMRGASLLGARIGMVLKTPPLRFGRPFGDKRREGIPPVRVGAGFCGLEESP